MKRVVIIGAGGLGVPALLALGQTVADTHGVIALHDGDLVELSNLHRQILYRMADLGTSKSVAAAAALRRYFPALAIEPHAAHVDATTIDATIANATAVLECSDNLGLKFLVNDACVRARVPLVIGGVVGFVGQVMAIGGDKGCYRCVFEAPPSEAIATCTQAGVLGPAAGVIGARQGEIAAAIYERGNLHEHETHYGLLEHFDLKANSSRTLHVAKRVDCAAHASSLAEFAAYSVNAKEVVHGNRSHSDVT